MATGEQNARTIVRKLVPDVQSLGSVLMILHATLATVTGDIAPETAVLNVKTVTICLEQTVINVHLTV